MKTTHSAGRTRSDIPAACLRAAQTLAASALLLAPLAASAQSMSGFTYNGLNFVSYQAGEYLTSTPAATAIRGTGANYAAVVATQYMQTSTSTTIAPETATTTGYNVLFDALSPTDAAVVSAIQSLQAQGLTVSLKPQVDSLDGIFRGNFAPTDTNAWFASYQTFILHYAQLASQNGVGYLVIGTELKSLTGAAYKSNWETIITQLRTQYPDLTLIYGANATGAGDEFTSVSFWADVDIIGVDGYFPLTNQADPSIAALVAAWTSNRSGFNIVAALKNLQSTYNKPLIFSEIGYVSVPGTNEQPYASLSGAYDPLEQQDCYEAFFQVFSMQTAWMKGVFWWDWSPTAPGTSDTGYTPQGKPAGMVTLPKWFGSMTPGLTLAAAQPNMLIGQPLSSTDVISATMQGGLTGAVTLTVSGLPAGVTGSFSNGAAAGTQVLTLTAAGNAAKAGPVAVTVTGTASGVTASTTINVTVNVPPSFSLAASPAAVSLNQTASVNSTITVSTLGGFASAVTLTAAGLPTGVTASFAAGTAAGTQVVTFKTSGAAVTTAPVPITITGTSGALTATTSVALTIVPTPAFTFSGADLTLHRGAGILNTSVITVTPTFGFTGMVALTCAITPTAAANPATCTLSPASVTLSGTTPQTTTLTISTTAGALVEYRHRELLWSAEGGTVVAFVLFFGLPRRHRRLPGMLAILLSLLAVGGAVGCSSSTPAAASTASTGTSPGAYTVTITGTAASTVATGTINLTVQ